jgi:carbon-monoxide dehydrogenase small subunit
MKKTKYSFKVNGDSLTCTAYPMARLLDVLREELRLTGTKEGCGEGECGACSVLLNGKLVNSCLVPMAQAENASVTTVEGLADRAELHPLQTCFLESGGTQCGMCTPGILIAAYSFLQKNRQRKNVSSGEIRQWLAGNLCRCTGYVKIIHSVRLCARRKAV